MIKSLNQFELSNGITISTLDAPDSREASNSKTTLQYQIGIDETNKTLYLLEWRTYYVVSETEFKIKIGNQKLKVYKLRNLYLSEIQFSNYIGKSYLQIIRDNKTILRWNIEVVSEKIPKILGKHVDNIEQLVTLNNEFLEKILKDLVKISSTLPFAISSPAYFASDEGNDEVNELFAYHYLRSKKDDITAAFETIVNQLNKKLTLKEEWVNPNEVDSIESDTIISIFQHPEYLVKTKTASFKIQGLQGYVPTKVLSYAKQESFDTPENRFVKYFLDLLIFWGGRVLKVLNNLKAINNLELTEIKSLVELLEYLRMRDIWDDIQDIRAISYNSRILSRKPSYSTLIKLYNEFRSYTTAFKDMNKAIENKDIAKIYEYWVFFKLTKELERILGKAKLYTHIYPTGEIKEGVRTYASFAKGYRLYFNRKITKHSYSIPVKPDYTLYSNDEKIIGVFDAKFKVDIPVVIEDENWETWAKIEDIYKMHTYRDALQCRFAIAIYPGTKSVFYIASKNRISEKPISDFSIEQLFTKKLTGIGYFNMKPVIND